MIMYFYIVSFTTCRSSLFYKRSGQQFSPSMGMLQTLTSSQFPDVTGGLAIRVRVK